MTPVLITAVCPACETRYKVQPSLRGQPMRCPNPQCRKVFTVLAEVPPAASPPPPQPPAPGNGHTTGSVGDLVPLVEAQSVEPPARSWKEPPPVRRPTAAAPAPAAKEPPRELPPGAWAPPPVRRGLAQPTAPPMDTAPEAPAAAAPEPVSEEAVEPHPPVKRTGLIVAASAVGFVALLAVCGWAAWFLSSRSEGSMAAEADQAYKQGKFDEARGMFDQLQKDFPSSDKRDDYHFMEALSDFRAQARAQTPTSTPCWNASPRSLTRTARRRRSRTGRRTWRKASAG